MSTMVCVQTCGSHTILYTYTRKQEKPVHAYQAWLPRKRHMDNVLRRFVVASFTSRFYLTAVEKNLGVAWERG